MTLQSEDKDPRTIWLLASCRFGEAVAIGMLIPTLPLFLGTLSSTWVDGLSGRLRSSFPLLAEWYPASVTATDEAKTALLFCFTGLAMALIQIFAGRVSDRLDSRKPLIIIGMALGSICSLVIPLLEHFWQLLLLRMLQGSFLGLTFPPMMAIIARHAPTSSGGKVLGIYTTIRLVGFGLGPILGGVVAEYAGYDAVYLVSGALLMLSVMLVASRVKDEKEFKHDAQRVRVLPQVNPIFRLLGAAIFIMMVGISAVISLFPYYQREFGSSQTQLGTMFAIFVATRCICQYPFGWIGDRFDKKWVLAFGLLFFIPLVWMQGHVENLTELTWLRMGLGVVSAMMSTAVGGISAERSEAGNRARVMGINTLCFSLGTAVGPSLTGFIHSQQTAFAIPALAASILLLALLALLPSDRTARSARRLQESGP
ncbi:MAG: MFS transporter [Planctomycetota bacterium]|nr:MFS transporter [Planctomycetota bacterium]